MTPSGKLTILYSFNSSTDYATNPTAPLLQATDGNFYGVLISRFQDLFRFTPAGKLTVLEKFILPGGVLPYWPLIQDTNGILYGLLQQGGTVNGGELFSLNIGAKPFVSLVSTSGKVGSKIGILGQGFSKSSVVKFGGVQATTLTLEGTTYISATVPEGAIDGTVTVTTGSTVLTSLQTFVVHNSWSSGAVMPTALMGAAAGAIGSEIYVVGGYTLSGAVGNNQIYNPEKNTWTSGAADPNPRAFAAYAVVNKKLYMFGGSNGSALLSVAEAYDPATNTWSTLAPVPYVSETASAVADKDVIYVIGGQDYSGYLTTVESYNTTTNTWTAEAPLPDAQGWAAVGLLGTTVVAADGSNGSINLGVNQAYNVTNNTWSELTPDPTPRVPGCYGVINGKLYVAGGLTQTMITLNEDYNPGTKKWVTLAPIPQGPGIAAGSVVAGGNLYCFGGGIFLTNVYDYVQIYQP
jgi:N-acetylneuraminic acid mutarotase